MILQLRCLVINLADSLQVAMSCNSLGRLAVHGNEHNVHVYQRSSTNTNDSMRLVKLHRQGVTEYVFQADNPDDPSIDSCQRPRT